MADKMPDQDAALLIDLSVPVAISSVLCRLTEKRFPVIGLYHMQWLAPSRYTLHPAFRSSFSNSLYRTASPPFLSIILARIHTYVKGNIRVNTCIFARRSGGNVGDNGHSVRVRLFA